MTVAGTQESGQRADPRCQSSLEMSPFADFWSRVRASLDGTSAIDFGPGACLKSAASYDPATAG
jgi:hypothetical protein